MFPCFLQNCTHHAEKEREVILFCKGCRNPMHPLCMDRLGILRENPICSARCGKKPTRRSSGANLETVQVPRTRSKSQVDRRQNTGEIGADVETVTDPHEREGRAEVNTVTNPREKQKATDDMEEAARPNRGNQTRAENKTVSNPHEKQKATDDMEEAARPNRGNQTRAEKRTVSNPRAPKPTAMAKGTGTGSPPTNKAGTRSKSKPIQKQGKDTSPRGKGVPGPSPVRVSPRKSPIRRVSPSKPSPPKHKETPAKQTGSPATNEQDGANMETSKDSPTKGGRVRRKRQVGPDASTSVNPPIGSGEEEEKQPEDGNQFQSGDSNPDLETDMVSRSTAGVRRMDRRTTEKGLSQKGNEDQETPMHIMGSSSKKSSAETISDPPLPEKEAIVVAGPDGRPRKGSDEHGGTRAVALRQWANKEKSTENAPTEPSNRKTSVSPPAQKSGTKRRTIMSNRKNPALPDDPQNRAGLKRVRDPRVNTNREDRTAVEGTETPDQADMEEVPTRAEGRTVHKPRGKSSGTHRMERERPLHDRRAELKRISNLRENTSGASSERSPSIMDIDDASPTNTELRQDSNPRGSASVVPRRGASSRNDVDAPTPNVANVKRRSDPRRIEKQAVVERNTSGTAGMDKEFVDYLIRPVSPPDRRSGRPVQSRARGQREQQHRPVRKQASVNDENMEDVRVVSDSEYGTSDDPDRGQVNNTTTKNAEGAKSYVRGRGGEDNEEGVEDSEEARADNADGGRSDGESERLEEADVAIEDVEGDFFKAYETRGVKKLVNLFRTWFLAMPNSTYPMVFEQKVNHSNYDEPEDCIGPLFRPFSNIRQSDKKQNLEAAKEMLHLGDGKYAWVGKAGNACGIIFEEDLPNYTIRDEDLEPVHLPVGETARHSPTFWVFKDGKRPEVPSEWYDEGKRQYFVPAGTSVYLIDGNSRVCCVRFYNIDTPVTFEVAIVPRKQMEVKPVDSSREEFIRHLMKDVAIGMNMLTHAKAEMDFAQKILHRAMERTSKTFRWMNKFIQLPNGPLPDVSLKEFPMVSTQTKPVRIDPVTLLSGLQVPGRSGGFVVQSSLEHDFGLDLSFIRGAIDMDQTVGRYRHHCSVCTKEATFVGEQMANTFAYDALDDRGTRSSDENNTDSVEAFYAMNMNWNSLKMFKSRNTALLKSIFGITPKSLHVDKRGSKKGETLKYATAALVTMEREMITAPIMCAQSVVAVLLLDQHTNAIRRDQPSSLCTWVEAKEIGENIYARKRLGHHEKQYKVWKTPKTQKESLEIALDIAGAIVKALHSIAVGLLGLKSLDMVLQLSTRCPVSTNDIVSLPTHEMFEKYGLHFPPPKEKWAAFCGERPKEGIRLFHAKSRERSLSTWTEDVCRVIQRAIPDIRSLFKKVVFEDGDIRFDIIVAQLLHENKNTKAPCGVANFIGSPLLDLAVFGILQAHCDSLDTNLWKKHRMLSRIGRCAKAFGTDRKKGFISHSFRNPVMRYFRNDLESKMGHVISEYVDMSTGRIIDALRHVGVLEVSTERLNQPKTVTQQYTSKSRLPRWRKGKSIAVGNALLGCWTDVLKSAGGKVTADTLHAAVNLMVAVVMSSLKNKFKDYVTEDHIRELISEKMSDDLTDANDELMAANGLVADFDAMLEFMNDQPEQPNPNMVDYSPHNEESDDEYEDAAFSEVDEEEENEEEIQEMRGPPKKKQRTE